MLTARHYFALGLCLIADPAFARTLQCNKAQTYCITEDINLTVGDRVGLFNADGELVATATVHGMSGEKRALQIEERNGSISADDQLRLLDDPAEGISVDKQVYQPHKDQADAQYGGMLGLSSFTFGSGATGEEVGAYGQWRKWGNAFLIARANAFTASARVRRYDGVNFVTQNEKASGVGALGGIGYESTQTRPFSVRVEADLGAIDVNSTLGGSSSLSDQNRSDTKMKNGVDLYGRWGLSGVYNLEVWHFELGFAESIIDQAVANTIVFGVSHDIGEPRERDSPGSSSSHH